MADNYLEKRYLEVFGPDAAHKAKPRRNVSHPSLDSLILKNRSVRGFDHAVKVTGEQLLKIVSVASKVPSARNAQNLRFRLVHAPEDAARLLPLLKFGGALPQLHLPAEGTEPQAFIIICSKTNPAQDRWIMADVGIVAQTMLLKSVELGLNGICIGAFSAQAVAEAFDLPYMPVLVLAIGKSAEKIQIVQIAEGDDHRYYRKEGIHYVPKVRIEDLII